MQILMAFAWAWACVVFAFPWPESLFSAGFYSKLMLRNGTTGCRDCMKELCRRQHKINIKSMEKKLESYRLFSKDGDERTLYALAWHVPGYVTDMLTSPKSTKALLICTLTAVFNHDTSINMAMKPLFHFRLSLYPSLFLLANFINRLF